VVPPESQEASWSDVTPVDVLGLEVGYRLIPMVDKGQDGELLKRIRGLRKKFARDIGFLAAPVHIRDNLELKPNDYRIVMKGVEIGTGSAFPGQFMAINPGRVSGPLTGRETTDPAFGLPAVWIDASQREQAHALGYTVVDASTVVATHINHLILSHASELLGRTETQALLEHIAKESPKLVEDLVPKLLPWPPCSGCCRTCSTRASISATCGASSRCWPSTRRAFRTPWSSPRGCARLLAGPSSRGSFRATARCR
jgi:flagellar biosynthesis protein FlhA